MNPDYSNGYYRTVRYSVNRKRQIINETLAELHAMHVAMIEDAVLAKESVGFPEANKLIDYIKAK
jgi:hypothetical protein